MFHPLKRSFQPEDVKGDAIENDTETEIDERLTTSSLDYNPDDLNDLLARHLVFRERNSGRLVLSFLHSFFKS
jgi:hypothetical protein